MSRVPDGKAGAPVGILPTEEDRKFVRAMSLNGISVRKVAVALGERFKLGHPMASGTMYHHFKKELGKRVNGRKSKFRSPVLTKKMEGVITEEMQALIAEISARGPSKERKTEK